jgi:RNA polymerase sigma-70 factor, ECF subfamily
MMPLVPFVAWSPGGPAQADTAALVAQVAAGDSAALAELYRREAAAVYRYALAFCGNPGWSADATQEAFVALATRPQGFDATRGSLGAYLAGVARHALAARWREGFAAQPLADDDEPIEGDAEGTASPETLLLQRQSSDEVWAALRRLPAPFREALVLVDLQERPYAEAARIAGIELNTLRTRVHRARLKLAALLGADPRDPS